MSNTVLEAMASGLPVIVIDFGGTAELLEGNGLVVPVDDEGALRDAVVEFRDEPGKRGEMGKVAEEYLRLYGEVAGTATELTVADMGAR